MPRSFAPVLASLILSSCASSQCSPRATSTASAQDDAGTSVAIATTSREVVATSGAAAPAPLATPAPTHAPTPREALVAWLKSRVPSGDEVVDPGETAPVEVLHSVARGEVPADLAHAYLALADVYFEGDYATEIAKSARKEGGFRAGARIHVPHLVTAPFADVDAARVAWPEDKAIKGLYIRGATATKPMFLFILDQMAKRDINAIVLDAKDYDGPVTYASKVPLALETHAAKGAPIRDLPRVIRFVHALSGGKIRVIMRVACFNDELMAKAKPALSVQSKWGKPYPIGWLDPNNTDAQDYILALVKESLEAGADEIQLDYVRYPVLGIKGADFHLDEPKKTKIEVIRDFVRRAHALTSEKKVPLSLDLFGVVAQGRREDIDMLGQDMTVLAPECEAFSPMVYPSHYATGFYGWDNPGDHPEIVGIGVKGSLDQIKGAPQGVPLAVVRPWIQAMDYKTTTYSPKYLQDEIRTGTASGGTGWLMWNPSQEYGFAWAAVAPKAVPSSASEKTKRVADKR